ncbi:BTB/POZ domain-containing protein At5g66560-like [Phragmites australis]|uniref:BTB/POZ domain-containing protein At5g66560-like n=1 Tax=Phragmites australis TaxID=29695 RepID=UPI002D77CEE2|nr:BTB/POZ domain-containing protein At5g66560-like [Phragmites australis]
MALFATMAPFVLGAVLPSLRRSSRSFAARGEAAVTALDSASASTRLLAVGVWQRAMLTTKGRGMRSKVEKRMARETGRTQRELHRAIKLRKKLMTKDEKLIYSLRRFPLMSRSKKLHDLIMNKESREAKSRGGEEEQEEDAGEIREEEVVLEEDEEVDVHHICLPEFPNGAEAFELATKFWYSVKLDLALATATPLHYAAKRLSMSDEDEDECVL